MLLKEKMVPLAISYHHYDGIYFLMIKGGIERSDLELSKYNKKKLWMKSFNKVIVYLYNLKLNKQFWYQIITVFLLLSLILSNVMETCLQSSKKKKTQNN